MDMYHREALRQLGLSLKASGDIVATVAAWPSSPYTQHAKECHINGAMANARKTLTAGEQLMVACA